MIRIGYGPTAELAYVNHDDPLMAIVFHDRDRRPSETVFYRNAGSTLLVAANDEEEGPDALTKAQAAAIAAFAQAADDTDTELRVCCDGGVGRSAACAAALLWATTNPEYADTAVFSRGDVAPNRHVFDLVREALLGPADEDETAAIEEMFERQLQLFYKFHAAD